MTGLTPPDLWRMLEAVAGVPDDRAGPAELAEPAEDRLDASFEDLGYDSLAVLQLAVRIELECGVGVPEDRLPELTTPRAVLTFVNGQCPAR
jgi:act minimal PKS acyl carrier protein